MELLFSALALVLFVVVTSKLDRPRGVSISQASLYRYDVDFVCFDGSAKIPFDHINDDYCDCIDGSDEPGTSACPNGTFHCTNVGHKPMNIPSSRVNDKICDCCDGTDEYDTHLHCENTCKEAGRAAREEQEKMRKLIQEGYEIYKEYCKQGTESKQEKQSQIGQLQQSKEEFEERKNELQGVKDEAEKFEKEAKDAHQKVWEEENARRAEEKERENAEAAFIELDSNRDNLVSVKEIRLHQEFDIDSNGEVGEEEAMEYLEGKENTDLEIFQKDVWPNIKEIYKKQKQSGESEGQDSQQTEPPVPQAEEPPVVDSNGPDHDDENDDRYDEDEEHYDDYEDDDDDEVEDTEDTDSDEGNKDMPEYDENTKLLISAADKARADFTGAEQQYREAESKLNDLNTFLSLDLGPNNEYYPLKDVCYEYTDREYTYKFCPFGKATQRSKSGGAETSLGQWGRWDGPEDNRYSVMLLDKGQGCWNGPNRSVKVKISCGINNELVGASEPNRCEYEYQFHTPAACNFEPPEEERDIHEEL